MMPCIANQKDSVVDASWIFSFIQVQDLSFRLSNYSV